MILKERHKKVAERFKAWQCSHQYFSIEHQEKVFDRMADEAFYEEIKSKTTASVRA